MTATPHLAEIDALKAALDARRPLSPEQVRGQATVFEAEETEYIHESNAIEGNTLTLAETEICTDNNALDAVRTSLHLDPGRAAPSRSVWRGE